MHKGPLTHTSHPLRGLALSWDNFDTVTSRGSLRRESNQIQHIHYFGEKNASIRVGLMA